MGTVQFRTLIEPLRKIIARVRGHFIHGRAVDLHMHERLLEVEIPTSNGKSKHIYVPLDVLQYILLQKTQVMIDMTSWLLHVDRPPHHMESLALKIASN